MHHFDIFDEAIIEKIEKGFKVVVVILGIILSIVGVSGDMKESSENLKNTKNAFDVGVTMLESEGGSFANLQSPEYYTKQTLSKEDAIYKCLLSIAKEKGFKNLTLSELKSTLTEEEKNTIRVIADNMKTNSVNVEKLQEEKPYRVQVFGTANATQLYDMVNAHAEDFSLQK